MIQGHHIRFSSSRSRFAFTLIEIIAVLVILAVLAAMAIGRLPPSNAELFAGRDQLASHLRYTQLRALADIEPWVLQANGSTYQILAPGSNPVPIPGTASTTGSLPGGVTVAGNPIIRFDPWGRPVDAGGNPLGSNLTLNLSGGGATAAVVIHSETGFIP